MRHVLVSVVMFINSPSPDREGSCYRKGFLNRAEFSLSIVINTKRGEGNLSVFYEVNLFLSLPPTLILSSILPTTSRVTNHSVISPKQPISRASPLSRVKRHKLLLGTKHSNFRQSRWDCFRNHHSRRPVTENSKVN